MKVNLVVTSSLLALVVGCGDASDDSAGLEAMGGADAAGSSSGGSGTSTAGTGGGAGAMTSGAGTSPGGAASTGGASSTGGMTNPGGAGSKGGSAGSGGSAGGSGGGGGTAAGGAPVCDSSWNPPQTANSNSGIPAGLDKEWARSGPATLKSKDTKIHQMMANGGKMRYCARWDSSSAISAEERQQAAALMRKCDLQWTDKLTGWGCWPHSTIDVKITMWVVRDAALLTDWNASEGSYVVGTPTNNDATDMACPRDCKQEPNQAQKTSCTGGQVYDEFLWLDGDKSDYTGWGWVDGFYMSASHFMSAAKKNANTETIVAHELGHSHTLMDFYEAGETPTGWTNFIMKSGTSSTVTETDGWMLRNVWRHLRSQWGFPAAQ